MSRMSVISYGGFEKLVCNWVYKLSEW